MNIYTMVYMRMFTEALFLIVKQTKNLKPPKCPWPEERINKAWCTHAMLHYSAVKVDVLLIYI